MLFPFFFSLQNLELLEKCTNPAKTNSRNSESIFQTHFNNFLRIFFHSTFLQPNNFAIILIILLEIPYSTFSIISLRNFTFLQVSSTEKCSQFSNYVSFEIFEDSSSNFLADNLYYLYYLTPSLFCIFSFYPIFAFLLIVSLYYIYYIIPVYCRATTTS